MLNLSDFRNTLILWILGFYLLFNSGFMLARIPPVEGGGVPIGEVLLFFVLLTIHYPSTLHRLGSTMLLLPFVLWWIFGTGRAIVAIPEHGMWALRDATHVIESLFLLVGFAFAVRPEMLDRFFKWLPGVLWLAFVYALGYPFQKTLQGYSPKLLAGAGYMAALFFTYTNISILIYMLAAYLLLFKEKKGVNDKIIYLFVVALVGANIFISQGRTLYLQILALYGLFMVFRRELLGKSAVLFFLLFLFLLAVPFFDIEITGRLGQQVSLEFILNHILAIGGIENEGVMGAAGGVHQRLGWWMKLFYEWTDSATNFLFGLGYGFPLIDFSIGVPVREPHNSYISIIARLGLVGISLFVWMHILLLRVWRRAYRECTRLKWREGQNRLLLLMVFFILIWVLCIGEDGLEKPFNAIPYYFFWGIVLRFAYHLKQGNIGSAELLNENPASA